MNVEMDVDSTDTNEFFIVIPITDNYFTVALDFRYLTSSDNKRGQRITKDFANLAILRCIMNF